MNLPGYDPWKLASPPGYDLTAAQERELEDERQENIADLREAIQAAFADARGELYLSTVREVVIEELNKLQPLPGEPGWQTKTPIPIPALG